MSNEPGSPLDAALAIIREEEALLARALGALQSAHEAARRAPHVSDLRSVDVLRTLRDEAQVASADDLPALLHEMGVRQKLLERPQQAPLPDLDAPYLAHLRIDDGRGSRDYLLGKASFVDPAAGVRIVDWRVAPIAKMFYRYREGESFDEAFPGRDVEGRVEVRRVVVIARGALTRIVCPRFVLSRRSDGGWVTEGAQAFDGGGAGMAARPGILGVGAGAVGASRISDVTALLDAEQFAAIDAPPEEPLVVLGSAGSGKTTVALHRLARIAASDPGRFPLSRMQVVVPERGLARLSTRLLEPLGAGAAVVRTLDDWALRLARKVFGATLPRRIVEAPALVSSLKRHPALYHALRERFATLKPPKATLRGIRRRLAVLFTDRTFLDDVVKRSRGDLPRTVIEETVRYTLLQLAEPLSRQLASIVVPEMKEAVDGRPIDEGTPDELAGTLDVEDLPILLFVRAFRAGLGDPSGVVHLVLDEAEDFSLFELYVLGQTLGGTRSVTLAGDESQQTSSSFAGWPTACATLGVEDTVTCRLAVSYRCPRPVVDLARHILGALAPEVPARAVRDGAPIGRFEFPDEAQAHLFLADAVCDLVDREPTASVAVIAHDGGCAARFFELVSERGPARLVLGGDFPFEPGIDVTDIDNAKGLEFDYVVVPDASADVYPLREEARRRLHVAATRTSHQLWVASCGKPSPLLPAKRGEQGGGF